MTRRGRLSKLEQVRPAVKEVQVSITRRIIDRTETGELGTVKTERRAFTVKPWGMK